MELALTRLSQGACDATLGAGPLVLRSGGVQTLRPDEHAFRQLVAQLGGAVAPLELAPVTTSGPVGLDVAFQSSLTAIDPHADYWQRATRGGGPATCDGRNSGVRPLLSTGRLQFEKGLPFGFSLGGVLGAVYGTGTYLVGADVKLAVLEDVDPRLPDLALRSELISLVGASPLIMRVVSFDAIFSKRFVARHALELSPYLGLGALLIRAESGGVDLTPNIDALACRQGLDPVCNRGGLGASDDDLGHDVRFGRVSLLRYRTFAGLAVRHRWVALTTAFATDLVQPRIGDRGHGETVARQWTFSLAPSVSF